MKNFTAGLLISIGVITGCTDCLAQGASALASFTEPTLSPAGEEIAFVSGGDIWTVSSKGGEARLLVAHESFESRPLYSQDGKFLAFTSLRSGNGDVYVLTLANSELKRLTFDDGFEEVSGWSGDSKWIYFSSTAKEISGMADVFKVSVLGGTPITVLDEPYTNEFFATPSTDGNSILYSARGIASRQWWRRGHSHLDESEIWVKRTSGQQAEYVKLVERGAKNLWPMWGKNNAIYYISDRDGNENIWSQTSEKGSAKNLTRFTTGRVLWPSMGNGGNTIVFERDLAVWTYDITSGKTEQVRITKKGTASTPQPNISRLTNQYNSLALSPDGKKIAFMARGEIFAVSTKDGGDASRVTHTAEPEKDLLWTIDSKSVIYTAKSTGTLQLFAYDFASKSARKLTSGNFNNEFPIISPDGKALAYIRNGKELRILTIASGEDKLAAKGYFNRGAVASNALAWSPDSQWIAFVSAGVKGFRNISIVPAGGGQAKQVSFLSNSFAGNLIWGKEGKYLLYLSSQRTENSQLARIDLVPRTPAFAEDRFQNLFNEPESETKVPAETKSVDKKTPPVAEKSKQKQKNVNIVWEGIEQRVSMIQTGLNVNEIALSNDGKTLLLTAAVAGQQNFYTWSLDEFSREAPVARQLSTTAGAKSDPVFSPDDKDVYFLEGGRIQKINLESKTAKPLDATAELEINFMADRAAIYHQAWEIQRDNFYDTAYHGRNWNEAGKKYEPYAQGAGSPDELRRVISLLLGELNASHSGISAPAGSLVTSSGRLGLQFDWAAYESSGMLKIKTVIPQGPAFASGGIKPGDYLLAVNDTLITAKVSLDELLLNKINKKTTLKIGSSSSLKDARSVEVRPINVATEKNLMYRDWVAQQKAYVLKASGGRLGYVHIFDMSTESLNQLYFDLDAENHAREGVVVDVRNNNGGFVNAYALDVISRKSYMTMTVRGLPSAPARTQLGQRALESPTILVINQHSLSDAEDFTEGYNTLQLGKVVGEPTGGWIIYTSGVQLIDGSNLRLPFIRVTDHEGKTMELVPRQPDILLSRNLGESAQRVDTQLDMAVKELLKSIDKK